MTEKLFYTDSHRQEFTAEVVSCRPCDNGYEGIQKTILLSERELGDWIKRGRIDDGFTLAAYSLFSFSADLR